MGVEPLIALPPRVLVAGRLQCGAARAGVRRGHGECAELAHLARGSSKLYTFVDSEKCLFVGIWPVCLTSKESRPLGQMVGMKSVIFPRRCL